jgi:predicted flap endonuclease-1-like 5' DNA nuclease
MNIAKIEGIGQQYAQKLGQHGIRSTESLLSNAASRKGRRELARELGISEKLILSWVNRADLMRVRGIGEEYSDLLEAAGVDTVRELANRRPDNLHQTLLKVNGSKRLVRRPPALVEVERWVKNARELVPVITY